MPSIYNLSESVFAVKAMLYHCPILMLSKEYSTFTAGIPCPLRSEAYIVFVLASIAILLSWKCPL